MPAWKCFSFCVFFQYWRHVKFFIRSWRIDDFPDNGKSHKGHCRNKYRSPEPWIFICKQHKKIERIHAEYQCCQHMVQTCHTLCTLRIAPKRFCNFDILFFCHNEKSYPSHLSFTSDHCKHSPDKNKEIRHIKNNSLKPFRSDLKPHIIHNMMLCIAVV